MDTPEPTPDLYLTSYALSMPPGVAADPARVHARASRFHRATKSLFGEPITPYGRREYDILWRLEPTSPGQWRILVQSTIPPTDEVASLPNISVKPVIGLWDRLAEGTLVQYVVRLMAVERRNDTRPDGSPHRRDIRLTPQQALERWPRRALKCGLAPDEQTLQHTRMSPWRRPGNPTDPGLFDSDLFHGTARITDTAAVKTAVRHGIGKGRSYGNGMLTVVPHG